ncbi:helicase-exonuclease AddAB subunit AddB [Metabacillus indicus]|uniref:helicase-exonuclease AddAB subunit AddB n=1 Tax=Metabacillus indicus TaxID=246786 RepID=UPI003983FD90
MGVRFILGRSGSGKTHRMLNEIRSELFRKPEGDPVVYLVPDQMTFGIEYELAKTPELGGMMRAQTFSFSRLAWRILQETGGISRYHITGTGIQMMLRKLIEQHKQDFRLFAKASGKSGFIDHMEAMITELKRYCLTPQEMEEKINGISVNATRQEQALADKLHDVVLLYKRMEKELSGTYVDSEDYLRLLAEKIEHSSYIQAADIYLDGFHSFTPQEYMVIGALMKHAKSVTVALTADKPFHEHLPHELHLFRMTGMTYHRLSVLAADNGAEIEDVTVLNEMPRFAERPSLAHLERFLESRPVKPYEGETNAVLAQASSRRAEIEGIARKIRGFVMDDGYRYKDLAVLIRNIGDYQDVIEQVFKDYEIPFFIDQKRSMLNHPVIELIRSALEVLNGGWRYEAVFRAVKTELLFPADTDKRIMREKMDQFENYVLSYGIQGSKWTSGERFVYRRYYSLDDEYVRTDEENETEEMINELKDIVVPPIQTLGERMKRTKDASGKAEALYLFLEELHIPYKLEQMRAEAEEAGRLVEAREHAQVWSAVIGMLDEFAEMMNEHRVSRSLFADMIDTGLEAMKFALVPPAMDQVVIASLERSRLLNVSVAFVAGANDGILPARPMEEGVLTEEDRISLHHQGIELAPTAREQLLDETFVLYMALSSASRELYISYPLADEEGKAMLPSIIVKRLKDLFPDIKTEIFINEPEELPEEDQLSFIVNEEVTLSYLTSQLQNWKRSYPISPIWWDAYTHFTEKEERSALSKVTGSLFYRNEAETLEKGISRELYGEHIQGSVSRMEMFKACAFSHYASHGLKLKDRQQFRLEAPDIGQLFHSALKLISDRMQQLKIDWKDLSTDQCSRLSHDAVETLAPRLQREILLSSNRHHYLKRKLVTIITRASSILSEHARASGFAPAGLELGFGKGGPLPPIRFKLENGCTMELVGRIDRVDKAESSKGVLLRIVDFKSSDKTLNLSEVYYGLALQMLTYLDVIITHSKSWLGVESTPAGVLYFHVHDPMIQSSAMLPQDKIDEEIFKKFKMKGLLLGDEEAVRLMDQTLDSGLSKIVSAGLKKDGGFRSDSAIASEAEFDLLRGHVRSVFQSIGTDITNGKTDISPYKLKDKVPCTFCSFKSVCQFDQSLSENQYRVLKDDKNDVILKRLQNEAGREES